MRRGKSRALVLGWCGGVGRAFVGLLERHPLGASVRKQLDSLFLLDRPRVDAPTHAPGRVLPPREVQTAAALAQLIDTHRIDTVIDLAGLGTFDCIEACAARGVNFLSTALETWPATRSRDRGPRTMQNARGLLPSHRKPLRGSHLVGSGMNPGIVNALCEAALAELGARVGAPPTATGLDLHAILITEEDTTTAPGENGRAFACTWTPRGCLEELYEAQASFVRARQLVVLDHPPHDTSYRVRCGDRIIDGMLVPHEEVLTLGHRHPTVELGFVYRLPPAARGFLSAHRDSSPETFALARLYPPHRHDLQGSDRVGVLLCSRVHGELWLGFDTPVTLGLRYDTNATELQVATGVLAGWRQLGARPGVHVVEELDGSHYLSDVCQVLGTPLVTHEPTAPSLSLSARRRPPASDPCEGVTTASIPPPRPAPADLGH